MDLFTTLNNGSLNLVQAKLLDDETLRIGADVLRSSEGTIEEQLRAAVVAMIASHKAPVEQMELPDDLESLTMRELARLANRYNMPYSSLRKAQLITALRAKARRLLEMA